MTLFLLLKSSWGSTQATVHMWNQDSFVELVLSFQWRELWRSSSGLHAQLFCWVIMLSLTTCAVRTGFPNCGCSGWLQDYSAPLPPPPRLCLRVPSLHLCSVCLRKTVVFAFRITQKISLFSSGSFLSYNHEDSSPHGTSVSPEWALWVDLGEDHHLTHYKSSVLLTLKCIGQTMIILEF